MSNKSPLCHSLYCAPNTTPLYMVLMLFVAGFLIAFIYDYILLIIFNLGGSFPTLCLFGVHIHHLYIGILVVIITIPLFIVIKQPKPRLAIAFFMGLGAGLAFSDLISHLTIDTVFLLYC